MANGTWTEARAKRQNELNAIVNEKERARQASLSVEKKEAHRARHRIYNRVFSCSQPRCRQRCRKATSYANMKLDPVKYKAYRQKETSNTENANSQTEGGA
jgi:hypothetical protein